MERKDDGKYRHLLFDLDGTLLNSKMGFWRSFEYALEKLGYPHPKIEVIEPYIGPPLEQVFMTDFGYDRETAMRGRDYYLEEYMEHGRMFTDPFFPGTAGAIARLQEAGITVGVCTNKGQPSASAIVERGRIGVTDDRVVGYNPDPAAGCGSKVAIIETYLRRFGLDTPQEKSGVLMIGDRCTDIQGADAVGIDGAAVTWGNGSMAELTATDAVGVFETYGQLLEYVGV